MTAFVLAFELVGVVTAAILVLMYLAAAWRYHWARLQDRTKRRGRRTKPIRARSQRRGLERASL